MVREIKFRLWDTLKKEMLLEGFHVFGETIIFNLIGQYAFETKGERDSLERYNDFQVMQFTGLVDKNGKEIYEGDILKMQIRGLRGHLTTITAEINFQGAAFWFTGGGFTDCNWHFYNAVNREIIGNIYENPELLSPHP